MFLKVCSFYFFWQVTDSNDNAPQFQSTAYSFDVPENMARGSKIGQVLASDSDAPGVNSQISYALVSDWANDVFSLNPNTGVFTLTASLDYEQVSFIYYYYFFFCYKLRMKNNNL